MKTISNNLTTQIKDVNRRPQIVDVSERHGDGVVIVRTKYIRVTPYDGRTTALNLFVRTKMSKAGVFPSRGSDMETLQNQYEMPLNIKSISNIKNLVLAYETIKSNPGNMTPGLNPETLDGIDRKYLERIQAKLKAGKFDFSPARRVNIPKPGKNETRPLTIASPREKIVQKAMQQIMEPIYEKIFLESSHGFRAKKGTRTAIAQLEAKFQSVQYIIEADFSKAFDKIPHDKLMEILKERITCEKTLRLLKSGLKAG